MSDSKPTPEEIRANLAQATCSETWYRNPLFQMTYTQGVKYLADSCGAYWLLDVIFSYQPRCRKDPMLRDMQFWTLKVDLAAKKGVVTCERDTGDVAIAQKIPYTDFPLDEIKIWVENGTLYLPSER